jgi:hypothetical protein
VVGGDDEQSSISPEYLTLCASEVSGPDLGRVSRSDITDASKGIGCEHDYVSAFLP